MPDKNGNMGYKLTDHIGYTFDRLGRFFLPGKIRRLSLGPRGLATTTPLAGQSLAGLRNRFPPAPPGGREGGSLPWGILGGSQGGRAASARRGLGRQPYHSRPAGWVSALPDLVSHPSSKKAGSNLGCPDVSSFTSLTLAYRTRIRSLVSLRSKATSTPMNASPT